MMNQEETQKRLSAIIEAQGMKPSFRERHSKSGNGKSYTYVQAYRYMPQFKERILIYLGRLEDVAEMSQNELALRIKREFDRNLQRKLAKQR